VCDAYGARNAGIGSCAIWRRMASAQCAAHSSAHETSRATPPWAKLVRPYRASSPLSASKFKVFASASARDGWPPSTRRLQSSSHEARTRAIARAPLEVSAEKATDATLLVEGTSGTAASVYLRPPQRRVQLTAMGDGEAALDAPEANGSIAAD